MTTPLLPPLRLLIIGCGGIASAWLEPLSQRNDVHLVGFLDLDPERADQRRQQFAPEATIGTDARAMLHDLQPDVVIDLTIPEAHADIACMALEHGSHVLAEKPMAANMAAARSILAATQKSGRIHAVMQNRRYLPGIRRVRSLLDSGVMGSVSEVHADFFMGAHFGGFRQQMPHVLLIDMAIHTVDQARFLADLTPVAVNAVEWNPPGSWYAQDASAMLVVECEGGVRMTYRGSWCAEGTGTSWQADWRIITSQGQVRWDGDDAITAAVTDPTDTELCRQLHPIEPPAPLTLPLCSHAGCIDDMLNCIRAGRQPPTHGADNILSLAIIQAAVASAEAQGARVSIDSL